MPLFSTITLVGSAALIGTGGAMGANALSRTGRRKPPRWLVPTPAPAPAPAPRLTDAGRALVERTWEQMTHLLDQVDALSLMVVQHTVDPLFDTLFGTPRDEHRATLGSATNDEPPPISDYERVTNRVITLGMIAIGTTSIGTLLFPPLYYASIPLVIGLSLPNISLAVHSVVHERRLNAMVLYILFIGGTWLKGYFLAAAIGATVYNTANKVLFKTMDQSTVRVSHVFGQQPRTVQVLVDGMCQEIPFAALQVQDIVVVRAGQPVPADGTIVFGLATIDQHMLTGEAQPAEKQVGDTVLAPTLVLAGDIHVRVEKTGAETVAAQILQTLTSMTDYRQESQLRATRLVDAMVLPILLCSGLAWVLVGANGVLGVLGAGNIFLLGIVNPIAMLNFLNIAAQKGILVKDARTLDKLGTIDMIVFDKTGTLTMEQPHVVTVHACAGFDVKTVLAYAAACEQHQSHPIAQAIVQEAAAQSLDLPTSDHVTYELGYGLRVTIGDTLVRVGSKRFLEQEGIVILPEIQDVQQRCHAIGHSLVLVGLSDSLAGAIELQPTLRPETPAVIAALHQRGLELAILSGDQEEPTRVLAEQLGVDTYFANTLPGQKSLLIQQLQAEGKKVCFVGDGINDAIALKQADISISIRGATSIATDTAQVVLMNQELTQILDLLQLSRKVETNLRLSLVSCTLPDVVLIGGVFLLHWGLYAAYATFVISLLGSVGTAMVPLLEQRLLNQETPA